MRRSRTESARTASNPRLAYRPVNDPVSIRGGLSRSAGQRLQDGPRFRCADALEDLDHPIDAQWLALQTSVGHLAEQVVKATSRFQPRIGCQGPATTANANKAHVINRTGNMARLHSDEQIDAGFADVITLTSPAARGG